MIEDYYCSVHGNIGNPDCKECWKNLIRLINDKNGYISISEEDKKKHMDLYKEEIK